MNCSWMRWENQLNYNNGLSATLEPWYPSCKSGYTDDSSLMNPWCYQQDASDALYYTYGAIALAIAIVGCVGNGLMLAMFGKNMAQCICKRYRCVLTPTNIFIVHLAWSDFSRSFLMFLVVYSSFCKRWQFGLIGCELYACAVSFFALTSMVTFSVIAFERYAILVVPESHAGLRLTRSRAKKICGLIWLYCFSLSLPPFLGFSSYVPDGLLLSCSWDYRSPYISNRTYSLVLLLLGFIIPVGLISYCYSAIICALIAHRKFILKQRSINRCLFSNSCKRWKRSNITYSKVIIALICMFLLSWLPYSFVVFVAQFWDPCFMSPYMSSITSLIGKSSVIYNPIVFSMTMIHFGDFLQTLDVFPSASRSLRRRATGYYCEDSSDSAYSIPELVYNCNKARSLSYPAGGKIIMKNYLHEKTDTLSIPANTASSFRKLSLPEKLSVDVGIGAAEKIVRSSVSLFPYNT